MKQVWKCDHCSDTNEDKEVIEDHEKECNFNPKNKFCYTCKHSYEDGYPIGGHYAGCEIKLNAQKGESDGNCKGWENES